ncbi:MAG: PhnA protein [Chitinophagaceae bacterium]|nr:PhnA protein [Chitinophagaceae bacterium]
MALIDVLKTRSNNLCELCEAPQANNAYAVPPDAQQHERDHVLVCDKCLAQIEKKEELNKAHWTCLQTSAWSEVPAVQIVAWRMLNRLRDESWAADLLDMMYLDDESMEKAKKTGDHEGSGDVDLHRDCHGQQLLNGDSVVLIKSLDVKGSTINAKMGTVVKNIRLVPDNTAQIEGRVESQMIVILTQYVRKQGDKA